jgi:hypothetical protein
MDQAFLAQPLWESFGEHPKVVDVILGDSCLLGEVSKVGDV